MSEENVYTTPVRCVWFVSGDVIQHLSGCRQCDGARVNRINEVNFSLYLRMFTVKILYPASAALMLTLLNGPSPAYSASLH